MVWNDETIRHLRDLWTEGHSTAEIGRRLGVSKNAIVGKAHRLDLDARPSPIRRDGAKPSQDRVQMTAGPTLPPLASAVPAAAIPLDAPREVSIVPPAPAVPSLPQTAFPGPVSNVQPLRVISSPAAVQAQAPSARPIAPAMPIVRVAPPRAPMSSSMPIRRSAPSCCWPIGEPGTKEFRFCDDASLAGKPYCDEHARLAYVRIRDRKEDAA
jgi:GcrA cell cycle regulator